MNSPNESNVVWFYSISYEQIQSVAKPKLNFSYRSSHLHIVRPGWLVSYSHKNEVTNNIKQILYVEVFCIVMANNTKTLFHHQYPSEADVKITAEGMELVLQLQRNEWVTALCVCFHWFESLFTSFCLSWALLNAPATLSYFIMG